MFRLLTFMSICILATACTSKVGGNNSGGGGGGNAFSALDSSAGSQPLQISPASKTVAVNDSILFTATGGPSSLYVYTITSGSGSLNGLTGAFTAPSSTGTTTVQVTDTVGDTSSAVITINPALVISPSSKNLAVNNAFTFSATGGVTPYTYSVASGGGTINSSTGVYTAPSSAGSATVQVTDAVGNTSSAAVTIYATLTISPASKTLAINNSYTFSATGGVSPYTYSVASGGGTINSTSGAYTAPSSTGSATVRVTDSLSNTSSATVTINPALAIAPSTRVVVINNEYTFTASGGTTSYTFSITSGGGSINSSTGVYTAPSTTGSATILVTDTLNNTSSSAVTIIKPTLVTSGNSHACALFSNGAVKCWGLNSSGQLGLGDTTNRGGNSSDMGENLPFVNLGTGRTATDIKAGYAHTCALLDNGTVKCWGLNNYGQLGQGDTTNRGGNATDMGDNLAAINLGTGLTASAIAVGDYHSCAIIASAGTVKCWGLNSSGQLGQGNTTNYGSAANQMGNSLATIYLGSRTAIGITAGSAHTCVVRSNNSVRCWGYNNYGQLGLGNTTTEGDNSNEMQSLANLSLGTGLTASSVIAGSSHTCVQFSTNRIKCWGWNQDGQLGQGNTTDYGSASNESVSSMSLVSLDGVTDTVTQIAAGSDHTCAILVTGSGVKCWGLNAHGQLGLGNTNIEGSAAGEMGAALPSVSLGTGRTAQKISASGDSVCALLDNFTVKCWGRNDEGQLGQGDLNDRGSGTAQMGDNLSAIVF